MKTPDEPINAALRDALQRRFDRFEPQPDFSLETSIFGQLQSLGRSAVIRQLLSVMLLITFVLTTTVTENSVSMPGKRIVSSKKMVAGIHQKFLAARQVGKKPVAADFGESIKVETLVNFQKNPDNFLIQSSEKKRDSKKEDLTGAVEKNANEEGGIQSGMAHLIQDSDRTNFADIHAIAGRPFVKDISLDSLKISVKTTGYITDAAYFTNTKKAWKIIFSLTPTNTFQRLTINPRSDVTYQNFRLPAPVSAQSMGYKVSGGLEKSGFQFLLTYGQFRQSIQYEIATNEFLVEPTASDNHRVVRKGVAVENQNTFKLVGLALKKQSIIRSGPFRNYYADIGAELSHELTHGQKVAWGNISVGKQVALTDQTALTIGPYLEYGFSKLLIPENRFQVQPYQIGLSVGVSFSKR